MMKRAALLALSFLALCLAVELVAQVKIPAPGAVYVQESDAPFTRLSDGACQLVYLPVDVKQLRVYRNGMRLKWELDYRIDPMETQLVIPLTPWDAEDVLIFDYLRH